jgi:hypothetical protein
VQLRAVWRGGDLYLSWIRRTRIGGDSWDQTEVPLGEEEEDYDVEILDAAGDAIRTFAAWPVSALVYLAVNIAADFPSGLPSPFRFRVTQRSATYGRGVGTMKEVWFS